MPVGNWSDEGNYPQGAELYVADMDGKNVRRLTNNKNYEAEVAVSPDENTRPSIDRVTDQDLNSEGTLLRSEALIRDVLQPYWDKRSGEKPPTTVGKVTSGFWRVVMFPIRLPGLLYRSFHNIPLDDWVDETSSHLWVSPLARSNLIEITYESSDPEWAANVLNKLIARHIERHTRLNQQSEAREFYEDGVRRR